MNVIIWNGDTKQPPIDIILSRELITNQGVSYLLNENTDVKKILRDYFLCKFLVDDLLDGLFIGHYFISNSTVEAQSRGAEKNQAMLPSPVLIKFDSEPDGTLTVNSLLIFLTVISERKEYI